jgi:hypothetical protein
VAANRGAPGGDGITVASIADGGADSVWVFLDGLAGQLQAARCGRRSHDCPLTPD